MSTTTTSTTNTCFDDDDEIRFCLAFYRYALTVNDLPAGCTRLRSIVKPCSVCHLLAFGGVRISFYNFHKTYSFIMMLHSCLFVQTSSCDWTETERRKLEVSTSNISSREMSDTLGGTRVTGSQRVADTHLAFASQTLFLYITPYFHSLLLDRAFAIGVRIEKS